MPFMTWVKTPNGYEPVEITDEEMVAQNTVKRAEREKMERIREQLEMGDMEREKMEFDKSRCYSALNADELKAGDKVIVASTIAEFKRIITDEIYCIAHIMRINDEDCENRFCIGESNATGDITYPLAYLVERAENCTNCEKFKTGYCIDGWDVDAQKIFRCEEYKPKTEPKEDNMNWNYESLPERQEMGVSDRVIVAIKGYNTVDVGYFDWELNAWFVDNNRYPVPVYAWQSIKPPRVEE